MGEICVGEIIWGVEMPNGTNWGKNELEQYLAPIKTIDPILCNFAKKYNTNVHSSMIHGDLFREITFVNRSNISNEYKLIKSIYLILKEKKWPPVYEVLLIVSNSYGKKELFRFLPPLRKIYDSWKRLRWEKKLFEFKETIGEEKLRIILGEAKTILDNFDENNLSVVPSKP